MQRELAMEGNWSPVAVTVDVRANIAVISDTGCTLAIFVAGRGDRIRTCDPLHPMQVRYQAALLPDPSVA